MSQNLLINLRNIAFLASGFKVILLVWPFGTPINDRSGKAVFPNWNKVDVVGLMRPSILVASANGSLIRSYVSYCFGKVVLSQRQRLVRLGRDQYFLLL